MAERCFPLDNITYSAEDMQLYLCTRSSGVYTLDSCLRVTAGTGLAVNVEPGLAWLKIGDFAGLAYCNDANNTLTHDAADTTYPRIDRVIVRYSAAFTNKMPKLMILKGTPASTPAAPNITRTSNIHDISLAQVLIPAGATAVGTITDERENASVCGLMTDGTRKMDVSLTGTATGILKALASAEAQTSFQLRNISYGTDALTPGVSSLTTGEVYLQYE